MRISLSDIVHDNTTHIETTRNNSVLMTDFGEYNRWITFVNDAGDELYISVHNDKFMISMPENVDILPQNPTKRFYGEYHDRK